MQLVALLSSRRRALFDPEGGMRDVRALDGISFADWFKSHGGTEQSLKRMWDPIGEPSLA